MCYIFSKPFNNQKIKGGIVKHIITLILALLLLTACQNSYTKHSVTNDGYLICPAQITAGRTAIFLTSGKEVKFQFINHLRKNPSGGSYETYAYAYESWKTYFKTDTPGEWKVTANINGRPVEKTFLVQPF